MPSFFLLHAGQEDVNLSKYVIAGLPLDLILIIGLFGLVLVGIWFMGIRSR